MEFQWNPQSGSSLHCFRSNWNLGIWNLVFAEGGKPEYPEKKPSEQGQEPTTNSIHIRHRVRELNPGHIGGRLRGR